MSDLLSSDYFGEPISEQLEENDVDSQTLVISWLNEAALADNITKIELLRKVQEVILHKDKNLLVGFLDNVLGFCADPSQEVRKVIVGFIEDACKTDGSVLPRISQCFGILLNDELIHVQKRAVQAFSAIYRASLHYLCITSPVTEQLERAWLQLCSYKASIINMIDNDNDGIRTNAIKCLEGIILMQTYADRDNEISRKPTGHDLSLEDIPLTLKVARRRKLEEEAIEIFTLLVRFHNSQHISSVNLMACMGSICTIAKMRPQFMPKVISALENLQTNLPPTLSNSQESSVRKHLKLQLFNLLKHPASMDMHNKITQLLSELGATNQEITKAVPKIDKAEERRRQKRILEREIERYNNSKKARLELPVEQEVKPKEKVYEMEVDIEEVIRQKEEAIDINDKFTFEKIKNIDTVVNLVMTTMLRLPDKLPAHFVQEYKPIANAGTQGHVKALSKMLAENITTGSLGPGAKAINKDPPMRQKVTKEEEQSIIMAPLKRDVEILAIPETGEVDNSEAVKAEATKKLQENMDRNRMEVSLKLKQRVKTLKLQEITKPLSKDVRERLLLNAVQRIVLTERRARCGALTSERIKIITTLAATFKQNVRDTILNFILEDTKSRLDLFFSWLYEEYSLLQGFIRQSVFKPNEKPDLNYNWVLCSLVRNASIGIDPKEFEVLLNRIYLEAPAITEEALGELVSICEDAQYGEGALKLMADLVIKRPPKQLQYIHLLLKFTIHENESLRAASIALALQLYRHSENLANQVEDCATTQMNYLTLATPPELVFGASLGRPVKAENWTEDLNRACLSLFIGLLPMNQVLIHDLCRVYIMTNADIKRTMLRMIESPVRTMGMDSPELLRLVETCNKGAETLVTRVIHILTEKAPPSAELVTRVRELYQSRVSDVRFLIPVLNGLTKKEILAALPKLIKLNPVVVKEVFNKLLNTHADARNFPSPVTPAELIVALHMIDPTKAELKFIVKATSLCLAEKEAYTQEVLAVAMQQLMEVTPLPTLLMRTVIQSLGLYPRLSGFVMNILQRLILKQVWKQKVVWDGFLKCCQRTKPQSLQVLMQLPPPQLTEAMQACPDLRPALQDHLNSFSENQRMHVPQTVQDAIMESAMPMDTSSLTKIEITESPMEPPGSMLMEPIPPGMD